MANDTYLQEIITYPYRVLRIISDDPYCVGLIRDIAPETVSDTDKEYVFNHNLSNYEYIDSTITEASTYVWAEVDIPRVPNKQTKNVSLYITVACSKKIMKLNRELFPGQNGTRRDTLVCHIDRVLNFSKDFGIGELQLKSVRAVSGSDEYVLRRLEYEVPAFNFRNL